MSRHHENTTNPKFIQMQQDYAKLIAEFGSRNPYLLSLIERARNTRPLGDRRFGYAEATQMIEMFDETSYTGRLHSDADMQDPTIFWDIMDCAKQRQRKTGNNRAIRALVFLYENLDKKETLTDEFKTAEKTPYVFIRRMSFLRKLSTEYTKSEDVYILNYSSINLPIMLILPYKNTFLRSVVVNSFKRDQSRYTITQKEAKELCSMEEVFGPYAETINSLNDLNSDILTFAKDYIMEKYADDEKLRIKYMKHLWCIFRYAVTSNPDRPYFKDSHLWNAILIINHRVPIQIAKGYVPVIVETYGSITAYEKVLYVYTNGEYFGADGVSYGMFAVNFSLIKTELYRWLAVNYIASTDQRRHPIVSQFLCWLEEHKNTPGYKYSKVDWIYADELCSYKFAIANKTRNGGSRNAYIQTIVSFLRWSAGTKRIHLQKGVFKYFDSFKHRYNPKPRSLSVCKKNAIISALKELAEKEPRYLLTINLIQIILRSDIRAGQLCALDLERMIWKEDGTSSYISRVKNRGDGMVRTDFSKRCTTLLKEAKELTEDIRRECPVEGPKTCLYLYRGIRRTDDEISVMDLQRFNKDLEDACQKAGLPRISTGNIRDTRQTAVAKFAHKHNLNDAQIATLTKHAQRTSLNSYIDLHIEDLLYAADNITLGTIKKSENA